MVRTLYFKSSDVLQVTLELLFTNYLLRMKSHLRSVVLKVRNASGSCVELNVSSSHTLLEFLVTVRWIFKENRCSKDMKRLVLTAYGNRMT